MRELKSYLHEIYKKSYYKYVGLQCLPNVCTMSYMSAQCPKILPNVFAVKSRISSDMFYGLVELEKDEL